MPNELLEAAAKRLSALASLPGPVAIERLAGGKNNQVYRLGLAGGGEAVLKLYHASPSDPRDRLGAEWSFIDYVWSRGLRNVPQPLAMSRDLHAGLYGLVPGRKLRPDEVDELAVRQAADFVAAANGAPARPDDLAPASEACFSLADHLQTVERRVSRLDVLDHRAPDRNRAHALVQTRLKPLWGAVREAVEVEAAAAGLALDAAASPCVSPSDFGFHNALVDGEGRATFIDFEYAGRDDPAKLVADFFCQPEIPVPIAHYGMFRDRLGAALGFTAADRRRCDLLLNAYRIKWVCIILNEFLAVGANRRDFADPSSDRAARAARQLDRADAQLALVSLSPA